MLKKLLTSFCFTENLFSWVSPFFPIRAPRKAQGHNGLIQFQGGQGIFFLGLDQFATMKMLQKQVISNMKFWLVRPLWFWATFHLQLIIFHPISFLHLTHLAISSPLTWLWNFNWFSYIKLLKSIYKRRNTMKRLKEMALTAIFRKILMFVI